MTHPSSDLDLLVEDVRLVMVDSDRTTLEPAMELWTCGLAFVWHVENCEFRMFQFVIKLEMKGRDLIVCLETHYVNPWLQVLRHEDMNQ